MLGSSGGVWAFSGHCCVWLDWEKGDGRKKAVWGSAPTVCLISGANHFLSTLGGLALIRAWS